jgi:hypothetical protein
MNEHRGFRWAILGGLILLVLFFLQGAAFIEANSQTYDEALYLVAGYAYLAEQDFDFNPETAPLPKELAALPLYLWYRLPYPPDTKGSTSPTVWGLERAFLYGSPVPADDLLTLARIPNLILGGFLVALVGWWSYRLWGAGAALLGMGLAALEPNLIAHSSLATTDLGIALFIFLAVYCLWDYVQTASPWFLAGVGISTGLALASKFSGVVLLGILGFIIGIHVLAGGTLSLRRPGDNTATTSLTRRIVQTAVASIVMACLAALVISSCYFFQGFGTWWEGLERQLAHQEDGHRAFFLGTFSLDGWWYYFPVAFLIKTPVGTLVLMLASLLLVRYGKALTKQDFLFLVVPVLLYGAVLLHTRINIGLRYALPVYPFLFVLTSRLATFRFQPRWLGPVLLGIPLVATAVSSLRTAPHHLAYFNELIGGPLQGYHYLSDSNLDWGQDLRGVKAFLEREQVEMVYLSYFGSAPPEAYGIRYQYLPLSRFIPKEPMEMLPPGTPRELLLISVTNLQGTYLTAQDQYRWLQKRTPVASIGYSIFVYDITGDAQAHFHLACVYRIEGLTTLELAELRRTLALDPNHREARRRLEQLQPKG